jgi:hypothetical protein
VPLQNRYFDDVFAATGIQRRVVFEGLAGEVFPPELAEAAHLFLLFHWEGMNSPLKYLNLVLRLGDVEASPGPEGLGKLLPLFNRYKAADLNLSVLRGRQFVATYAKADEPLVIEAVVDTSDGTFAVLAKSLDRGGALVELTAVAPPSPPKPAKGGLAPAKGDVPTILSGTGKFHVWFGPATLEPDFDGVVALDFGNTSSTLVYLPQANPQSVPRPLRYFGQGGQPDTVSTIVYLQKIGQKDRLRDAGVASWPETEAEIGTIGGANDITQGHLELGAKRQVVAPKSLGNLRAYFPIPSPSPSDRLDEVEFSRKLSADVFIQKLLGKFRENHKTRPRPLAVTYPTSYSRAEVEEYKQALAAAACRDTGNPSLKADEVVRLMIDEASAACFYHIFHDLIDRPGGIYGARYLYPRGLNVLVFDCGGGTTDLALLHVDLYPDAEGGAGRVDLKVLGRSGDRTFGGDQMTRQVFRLVKLGLARALVGSGGAAAGKSLDDLPKNVADLPSYLNRVEDQVEQILSTRWTLPDGKPMTLSAESRRIRQKAVALLWEHAEGLKVELAREKPDSNKTQASAELIQAIATVAGLKDSAGNTKLATALNEEVTQERVGALIGAVLARSLDKANRLLEELPERLAREEHAILETARLPVVHRLYAVGNATRHPVVQKALTEQLNERVRFRDTRCLFPAERKLVVAQGASRALAAVLQYHKMVVRFDRQLVDKLAYDVTFYNAATKTEEPFYKEDTLFRQVADEPHTIAIPDRPKEEGPIEMLRLRRRWPGDREGEPFLKFPFAGGVRGKEVKLSYREKEQQFFMKDDKAEVAGLPEYEAEYVAPPQSGVL